MEYVREYVMMLMTAAVTGSLASLVLPERAASGGMNKYIRRIASLVLLIIMISPVKDAVAALAAFSMNESAERAGSAWSGSATGLLITTTLELLAENVEGELKSRFGISEASVEITADDSDVSNIKLTQITITLADPADSRKSGDVGRYIAGMLECTTVVADGEESERYECFY